MVYVQDLQCGEPVGPPCYDADFEDICVHCCEETSGSSNKHPVPRQEEDTKKQKLEIMDLQSVRLLLCLPTN